MLTLDQLENERLLRINTAVKSGELARCWQVGWALGELSKRDAQFGREKRVYVSEEDEAVLVDAWKYGSGFDPLAKRFQTTFLCSVWYAGQQVCRVGWHNTSGVAADIDYTDNPQHYWNSNPDWIEPIMAAYSKAQKVLQQFKDEQEKERRNWLETVALLTSK